MANVLTPITPPVTLQQAKDWLRIPDSACSEDTTVTLLIASATNAYEQATRRKAQTAQVRKHMKKLRRLINLPWSPLVSVESVTVNGDTMAPSEYDVIDYTEPGYIRLKNEDYDTEDADIVIDYTVGYTDAPDHIKQTILMMTASGYEQRSAIKFSSQSMHNLNTFMATLIRGDKIRKF